MKISVTVPTMWMANDFFLQMLPLMLNCSEVGEVIIIDNNSKQRPDSEHLKHEKVKILDFGKNLYYNKSMNVGAEESKFEILCLLNDDVIFDPIIFKVLVHSFEQNPTLQEKVGMIYPHPEFFNRIQDHQNLVTQLKLVECIKRLDGFGCCMFVLKKYYRPIPDELVQHFGDVWYHKTQLKEGRKNFWLYNWVMITNMRTTTEKVPEIKDIIMNDWKIANEVFDKNGVELEDHSHTTPVFTEGLLQR